MTKKYRVVFFGITLDRESFRQNMAKLGVPGPTLDKYLEKAPIVLKRELTLADARRYAETIINAGGIVTIQETGEFNDTRPSAEKKDITFHQDFVICPNCGFKQNRKDSCVRCSFDLSSCV